MLSLNPGLKDITHSITGGSIHAQGLSSTPTSVIIITEHCFLGYWMPYDCARAVCATFCHRVAPALVPLFGPDFPLECISPRSANFERMVISQELVWRATQEAGDRLRESSQSVPVTTPQAFGRMVTADRYAFRNNHSQDTLHSSYGSLPPTSAYTRNSTERSTPCYDSPTSAISGRPPSRGYMITPHASPSWTPVRSSFNEDTLRLPMPNDMSQPSLPDPFVAICEEKRRRTAYESPMRDATDQDRYASTSVWGTESYPVKHDANNHKRKTPEKETETLDVAGILLRLRQTP